LQTVQLLFKTFFVAFKLVDFSLCAALKCPKRCPKLLDPVCGFDGKAYRLFDNKCLLSDFNDCHGSPYQSM
jgi:hypothetical protein